MSKATEPGREIRRPLFEEVPARAFFAVIACVSIFGITIGLGGPLLSIILEKRGTSETMIGVVAAMPAFGTFLMALVVPKLLRAFGTRPVIYCSAAIEAISFLLLPFLDTLAWWLLIRLVMGATAAGLFIASETWINQLANDSNRGRIMAIYAMVLGLAMALGPVILVITGTEGFLPFVVGAVVVALAGLVLIFDRDTIVPPVDGESSFNIFSFVFIAPTIAFAILVTSWYDTSVWALLPVYGIQRGLDEPSAALLVSAFSLGMVVLTYPIGWATDRMDRYLVLMGCGVGGAVGAVMLPVVFHNTALLWFTLFLCGGFANGLYGVAMAIVGDRFRGVELATAQASFGSLWGVGALAGPLSAGFAMDATGHQGLPLTLVVTTGAFLIVAVVRYRGRATRG